MTTDSPVTLRIPSLRVPLRLLVHGDQDQYVSRRIREEGIWEPYESSLLLELLNPGDVFVDVGANIGYFSVLAAAVVGEGGTVCAFEPDPANFRLLQKNTDLNGFASRITAVAAGLSATDDDGRLYLSADNLGDHQIYATSEARHSLPVILYNGSRFLGNKLRRIDVLKVDTQGSEYAVMAGLLPLLSALPSCPWILIELTPRSLREAGSSGRKLIELLALLHQPFWIVDHIEHRLVASSAEELGQWCDDVDEVPADMGFMNILLGPAISQVVS